MTLKPRFWECFFFVKHTAIAFDNEKSHFHFTLDWTKDLLWKFICIRQMTLKPHVWGCFFFVTHTATASDSELSDFHFIFDWKKGSLVKIHLYPSNDSKATFWGLLLNDEFSIKAFDSFQIEVKIWLLTVKKNSNPKNEALELFNSHRWRL